MGPQSLWLRTTDLMNDIMNLNACSPSLFMKHANVIVCCVVTDKFSLLFTVSVGIRWMIGQTEIDKGSNYGNKDMQMNNN